MKKEKSMKIFISKDLSSDEEDNIEKYKEYQCKPNIRKEDFKDYIHVSDDDESSQKRITSKKEKVKRKKDSNPIQKNKTISQKITQKNLAQEDDFKKLQKKAEILGADSLDYSKRKIINMWLNTTTKKFISVLPKLKITLLIKIKIDAKSISIRPKKLKTKMVD